MLLQVRHGLETAGAYSYGEPMRQQSVTALTVREVSALARRAIRRASREFDGTLDDVDECIHYTDVDGLKGILSASALRLTNVCQVLEDRDDPAEMKHLQDLVHRSIGNLVGVHADFRDQLLRTIDEVFYDNLNRTWNPYAVCFTAVSDSDLHWRTYGREGQGFAIAFRTDALRKMQSEGLFALEPVLYREETILRRLNAAAGAAETCRQGLTGFTCDQLKAFWFELAIEQVVLLGVTTKRPVEKWEWEREIRGICFGPDLREQHNAKGRGFVSRCFAKDAIQSVTLGPNCEFDSATLRALLNRLGYPNAKVSVARRHNRTCSQCGVLVAVSFELGTESAPESAQP